MTEQDYNNCIKQDSDGLFRFLTKISGDIAGAKDLTQDVFLKLWEHRTEIETDKARAWLFRVAYNSYVDNKRHNKYMVRGNDSNMQCQKIENDYTDLKSVLINALLLLPKAQRSAVLLRDYEGYSYEEIGKILSLSEQQVKVYIFRARTSLKQIIGKIENVI